MKKEEIQLAVKNTFKEVYYPQEFSAPYIEKTTDILESVFDCVEDDMREKITNCNYDISYCAYRSDCDILSLIGHDIDIMDAFEYGLSAYGFNPFDSDEKRPFACNADYVAMVSGDLVSIESRVDLACFLECEINDYLEEHYGEVGEEIWANLAGVFGGEYDNEGEEE